MFGNTSRSGYPGKSAGQPPMQRLWHEKKFRRRRSGKVSIDGYLREGAIGGHTAETTDIEEVYPGRSILSPLRGLPTTCEVPTNVSEPLESGRASSGMCFDSCRPERWHFASGKGVGGKVRFADSGDLRFPMILEFRFSAILGFPDLSGMWALPDVWIPGRFGISVFLDCWNFRCSGISVLFGMWISGSCLDFWCTLILGFPDLFGMWVSPCSAVFHKSGEQPFVQAVLLCKDAMQRARV